MTDNITLPRSVVEQALEALNASMPHNNDMDEDWPSHIAARRALRAALEQPQVEQEPVAYFYTRSGRVVSTEATDALMQQMIGESGRVALYAHPQPPRQPLTAEAIQELADEGVFLGNIFEIVRRIEEEHGIFKVRAHGIGGEA